MLAAAKRIANHYHTETRTVQKPGRTAADLRFQLQFALRTPISSHWALWLVAAASLAGLWLAFSRLF